MVRRRRAFADTTQKCATFNTESERAKRVVVARRLMKYDVGSEFELDFDMIV